MRLSVALLTVVAIFAMPLLTVGQEDRVNPAIPRLGDPVVLTDARGSQVATMTLTGVERGWDAFSSAHHPPSGTEYVAFTLELEVTGDDELTLSHKEFDLQVDPGILVDIASVRGDDIDPPQLTGKEEVAAGDTLAFTVIFSVPEGTPLTALYWAPEGAFLTIAVLDDAM